MDMLVEIVNLLGPPSVCELKEMNIKFEEIDSISSGTNNSSSFVKLILSMRTFKTYEERLRDKLEYTTSGRQPVPKEILDVIANTLQYVAKNRMAFLSFSKRDEPIEE